MFCQFATSGLSDNTVLENFDLSTIAKTLIGTVSGADALDVRDITGNGLPDLLVGGESDGSVQWYEHTTRGNFTKHVIDAGGNGLGWEGACWIDIDGDGEYEVVMTNQDNTNGGHWLYKADVSEDYDGTWTGGKITGNVISTQDLKAVDLDGDGQEELIFTNQVDYKTDGGATNNGGAVSYLKYDSGALTSSGSYTTYRMSDMIDAWWMSDLIDFDGDSLNSIVVGRRSNSGRTVGGISILEEVSPVTGTWTKTDVVNEDQDWLHVHTGNFFGTSNKDVLCQSFEGELAVFDYSNSWAKTTIVSSQTKAMFNAIPMPSYYNYNGRNRILSVGGVPSGGTSKDVCVWRWDGSTWEEEITDTGLTKKPDDRMVWMDLDGDDSYELMMVDGELNQLYYFTFS